MFLLLLLRHFGQVWGVTRIAQGGAGGKQEEEGGQNRLQGSTGTINNRNKSAVASTKKLLASTQLAFVRLDGGSFFCVRTWK